MVGNVPLGQKQTLARFVHMSALPPKADSRPPSRNVRFGPEADIEATVYGTVVCRGCLEPSKLIDKAALLRLIRKSGDTRCGVDHGLLAHFNKASSRPVEVQDQEYDGAG
jgi:hypothetical protein